MRHTARMVGAALTAAAITTTTLTATPAEAARAKPWHPIIETRSKQTTFHRHGPIKLTIDQYGKKRLYRAKATPPAGRVRVELIIICNRWYGTEVIKSNASMKMAVVPIPREAIRDKCTIKATGTKAVKWWNPATGGSFVRLVPVWVSAGRLK